MITQKNFIPENTKATSRLFFFFLTVFPLFLLFYCSTADKKSELSPTGEIVRDEKRKDSKPPAKPSESEKKKEHIKGGAKTSDGEFSSDEESPSPTRPKEKSESGLKAGFADDNKQFNLFLNFLEKFKGTAAHLDLNIKERIILTVKDKTGDRKSVV